METTETRDKIKQAVVDILKDESGQKLNMRNISKATGLSPGTIYYHFPNKAEIIIEVVDSHWQECLSEIENIKFDDGLCTAVEQLYACILQYFLTFRSQWIKELSELGHDEKRSGRKVESVAMKEIESRIRALVTERKEQVSEECIAAIGLDGVVRFIYDNFMVNMKRGEQDCKNLTYVIRKVTG